MNELDKVINKFVADMNLGKNIRSIQLIFEAGEPGRMLVEYWVHGAETTVNVSYLIESLKAVPDEVVKNGIDGTITGLRDTNV